MPTFFNFEFNIVAKPPPQISHRKQTNKSSQCSQSCVRLRVDLPTATTRSPSNRTTQTHPLELCLRARGGASKLCRLHSTQYYTYTRTPVLIERRLFRRVRIQSACSHKVDRSYHPLTHPSNSGQSNQHSSHTRTNVHIYIYYMNIYIRQNSPPDSSGWRARNAMNEQGFLTQFAAIGQNFSVI